MNFLFVTGLVTVTRHSYYCRLSLERENYLSPGAAPTRENKINSALCRGQARARLISTHYSMITAPNKSA
jgi:hypothetical protein